MSIEISYKNANNTDFEAIARVFVAAYRKYRDRELLSMLGLRYWLDLLPLNSAISN